MGATPVTRYPMLDVEAGFQLPARAPSSESQRNIKNFRSQSYQFAFAAKHAVTRTISTATTSAAVGSFPKMVKLYILECLLSGEPNAIFKLVSGSGQLLTLTE
jgi:hypothetical protein